MDAYCLEWVQSKYWKAAVLKPDPKKTQTLSVLSRTRSWSLYGLNWTDWPAEGLGQDTQKLPEVNRKLKTGATSTTSHDRRCSKWVAAVLGFNLKENKEQLWFNTSAKDPKMQRCLTGDNNLEQGQKWTCAALALACFCLEHSYCCLKQSLMETSTGAKLCPPAGP